MPVRRPWAVQLTLSFTTAGFLSLTSLGSAHKAGLRLRWLPLHHILCHKHSGSSLFGHTVDLTVNKYHDDSWGKERHKARGKNVPRLIIEKALLPLGVILVLHLQILLFLCHEEWWGRDDDRYEPHDADHCFNPFGRPFAVVADSFSDRPVAVEADGTEVDDRRSAKQDVQSQVERAPRGPEVPVTHDLETGDTN